MALYLLVHGAWHDGTCWDRVAARLRSAGHQVMAPSLMEAQGVIAWSRRLQAMLRDALEPVLLVGHSLGGYAISHAAERVPQRVRARVYLDAYMPAPGFSSYLRTSVRAFRVFRRISDPALRAWWAQGQRDVRAGRPLSVPPPGFLGLDPADAEQARVYATLCPLPAGPRRELLLRFRLPSQPTCYLRCTQTPFPALFGPSIRYARARAQRDASWRYEDLDAPHDVMVTHPRLVADALLALAQPPASVHAS
jgi:pimeloyl-ACP methyl ester carboxylesterase